LESKNNVLEEKILRKRRKKLLKKEIARRK